MLFACMAAACASSSPSPAPADLAWLVVEAPPRSNLAEALVTPGSVLDVTRFDSRLVIAVDMRRAESAVRIEATGACVLTVPVAELRRGEVIRRKMSPWLDFGGPYVQRGFDSEVRLEPKPGCADAESAEIEWKKLSGEGELRDSDGAGAVVKTPKRGDLLGDQLDWGIVPVSPRTQGEIVVEAAWTERGRKMTERVRVTAASRSRGLPNVGVGAELHLSPSGWKLENSPSGAKAKLHGEAGALSLTPDVSGIWALVDGEGRRLTIHSGRYDEIPLDCGRCHEKETRASARTAMTTVLSRRLGAAADGAEPASPGSYPQCAVACHAVGEPGLHDGGFVHAVEEVGADLASIDGWQHLPRSLRRVGGVGCFACHGPGAIPEPSARWSILRSDVCAHCHDSPPRYTHVQEWKTSAMARADADPEARSDPECARCHTASGFLARHGATVRTAPEHAEPIGISCPTCHAPHSDASGPKFLLRRIALPAGFAHVPKDAREASAVCFDCHTPDPEASVPSASAAALWAGRGGIAPNTGAPLLGKSPHTAIDGGCGGCHQGHDFRASRQCKECHPGRVMDPSIRARAETLWPKLVARGGAKVPSGDRALHAVAQIDRGTALGRAAYDVMLVLGDRGAAAHNARYAKKLLDAAEEVVTR